MIGPPDHAAHLVLDGAPPSMNAIPDANAPLRAEAATWQARIAEFLRGVGPAPNLAHVEASVVLTFEDHRRRSPANYCPVLARALAGALVEVGWLADLEGLVCHMPTFERGEAIGTAIELRGTEREPMGEGATT